MKILWTEDVPVRGRVQSDQVQVLKQLIIFGSLMCELLGNEQNIG
jgi:hypothetical protein